jgi:hypothetical protein
MREELLHFIWRFRYFNHHQLSTEAGQPLEILSPGRLNKDQGPDFRNARVRIGDLLLEGPVELHIYASDWIRHAHDDDAHYQDTILHVVWENDWRGGDDPASLPGGVPMLVLQQRVPKLLLDRYDHWMKHSVFVPCERQLRGVDAGVRADWLHRLLLERLQQRSLLIRDCLDKNHQDWEETTWIWMARSMGQPVNAAAFEAIARSLPVRLLSRYPRPVLETLLLGQAGLLEEPSDFPADLRREYRFEKTKHGLTSPSIPLSFLRMRPAHFPSVRLLQLARLTDTGWFASIREAHSPVQLLQRLEGREGLGEAMRRGVLINAFIPLLFAYGWLRDEPGCRQKALAWLRELSAENNGVVARWRQLGMTPEHAGDTQALVQLKKEYCDARRCLHCAIGRALLGQ